ncbi:MULTISPECIES: hypothetical protein [unclassified Streptomyces]|uniref:hypothetical protein n=1 Tax=unclassified Streptomyces TaxID=2593676 RepID=UPI0022B71F77|nr:MULTISPECIES: hypothetical protein [unclassified Streptomyces]MCZ7414104.1 hypothetical protein [Streptomyces sp. WMMC897]MCZ7431099.1 hypothetical protein [Streptomyces sp. WMMC1477]
MVVGFGVSLLGQTEPDCVPSETVRCNVVIDGRVVGEADASDADGERVQNVLIAIAVMTLGGVPLGMLLWNGYQVLRRHRRA